MRGLTVFSALLLPVTLAVVADAKVVSGGGFQTSFKVLGTAGMKIEGATTEGSVTEATDSITITIPLTNLATGISLRDKHMKEKYLQVDKFPNAELVVPRASLKFPAPNAEVSADANGTLKLHGQTKPVVVHYTTKHDGDTFRVNGTAHFNMADYGISVPSYLGVTVKPDVDVTVKFNAKDT